MSRRFQFRLGCAFWLVAAVALIIGAQQSSESGSGLPAFGVFAAAVIGLMVWGAFLISKNR